MSFIVDFAYSVIDKFTAYFADAVAKNPFYIGVSGGLVLAVAIEVIAYRYSAKSNTPKLTKKEATDKSRITVVDYSISGDLDTDVDHVIELLDASGKAQYRAYDILSSHEEDRPPNDKMFAISGRVDVQDKAISDTKKLISLMFLKVAKR